MAPVTGADEPPAMAQEMISLRLRTRRFFREVRRRKVFRAASIYLVAAWTLSLGAAELFPAFDIPDWGVRLFVIVAVLGFPLVVVGAWVFEITSEGVVLDRVAKAHREQGALTQVAFSSSTTTWAQTRHIEAIWRDEAGDHVQYFSAGFILGRDPVAELCIDDPRISRLHARVSYEQGQWWIEDLESRNGTNVNGSLITAKAPLGDEAAIYLYEGGRPIHLRVRKSEAAAESARESAGGSPEVTP